MRTVFLGVDEPRWGSFLRDVPHDVYHLPSYAKMSAAHEGGEATALYVEDGPRRMLLPLILRAIPGSNQRDATSPYGYPGPLVDGTGDPTFLSAALVAGMATLREAEAVTLFVRLHPLLNPEPPEHVGEVVLHGETVSVDLTVPSALRWAQMRHNHRRDITKAVRTGYLARVDQGFERFGEFKRIYRATMARRSAASYYLFDDAYFEQLREALGDRLHLCVVEKDDVVAAAGLFTETGGIVQYHLGGTDEKSIAAGPSKLLILGACFWAEKRGNHTLHLGGGVGGATDSLFYFKAGFSPLRHPYRTLRVVLDDTEYRRLVGAPDRGLNTDELDDFFPAYRVVGAGAIVVRDVEPDTTVVGPVARPTLRTRRTENLSADDVAVAVAVPAAQAVGKVRLLDAHAPEWSEFLRETPHDFYHLPAYVALSAAHERGEAVALCVEVGHRSLLLPLILRSIPGSDRRDATSPYGYPGPLLSDTDDPAFMSEALAAGLDGLRSEGIVSAFVRFHPLLNTAVPEGVGAVVLHGDTISIDLTQPPEVLWAQTRRNHRRDITRAIQNGLRARIDPGFERYDAFKRLYRVTMDRLEAAPYYYFDDEYFDGLRDALRERLHLCVVEDGDVVAAAGLLVETGGIVEYHLMGIAEAFAHAEPSKLMIHFAREWARERGNRYLHLGGGVGGADDSLLHYKVGFSPLRFPFRTLRAVLDQAEYRRLVVAHHASLDPDILGGFFPAYRAE